LTVDAGARGDLGHDAFFLVEQGEGEVLGGDFRMALARGQIPGVGQRFLSLDGELVGAHGFFCLLVWFRPGGGAQQAAP
jgi:hypothetical protein